jgi:hypothetical protein
MAEKIKVKLKAAEYEAFQWNGERPLPAPLVANWDNNPMTPDKVSVQVPGGWIDLRVGDWIVLRGGVPFVYTDGIFQEIYTRV